MSSMLQKATKSLENALAILKEYNCGVSAIKDATCDGGMNTHTNEVLNTIIDTHMDSIRSLEEALESIAYTWDGSVGNNKAEIQSESTFSSEHLQREILKTIARHYEEVAFSMGENKTQLNCSSEDVADAYLDWAVACKRSNLIDDCIRAHLHRMELCPLLKITDAIRLLGIHADGTDSQSKKRENNISASYRIEEISTFGIFESELVKKSRNDFQEASDLEQYYYAHRPTKGAIEIGKKSRAIFHECKYNLKNCSKMLFHAISNSGKGEDVCSDHTREKKDTCFDPERIYSANDFVSRRHIAWDEYESLPGDENLKVLACLFLFGLSLEKSFIADALGNDRISSLMEAGLLTVNAADGNSVVGQIQIYPLDTDAFDGQKSPSAETSLFMTDWSLESLRLPRNAIMSIGYDSLELIALSSGKQIFTGNSSRVLDLCSGCGIQGIFSAKRYLAHDTDHIEASIVRELMCADLNERACHFITGNVCLNDLDPRSDTSRSSINVIALESNVYEPLRHGGTSSPKSTSGFFSIGTFETVLSNPPFVAVPFAKIQGSLTPALYSAGGSFDGMNVLREILKDLFSILDIDGEMLMVTEIPNVEDGCEMLENMLKSIIPSSVKVAYVEQDVETVEEYAEEREVEAGYHVQGRDWVPSVEIRNRALVLISISRAKDGNHSRKLFSFDCVPDDVSRLTEDHHADEEDLFLTREGIDFARQHLLGI